MPTLRWRHIIVNTKNSWLRGDARGFRSRAHRIHSSGDYKNPPPPQEHVGLRRYHNDRDGDPISLAVECRPLIVHGFRDRLLIEGFQVLVVACAASHLHALAELPDDRSAITQIIGRCKRAACEAVKDLLPGSIWAAKGEFKRIKDRSHQVNAFKYIRDDQGKGAYVWTFRNQEFWMT